MKYIILVLLLGLFACGDDGPPCPAYSDKDFKPGLFSRDLGSVKIDDETCRIIETFEKSNCNTQGGGWNPPFCEGKKVVCYERTLTRITKCPSGTIANTIGRSNYKPYGEEVK